VTAAGRWPRSTSSPPTTVSPWPTWSPTTTSTTRPTARAAGTAATTTGRGTAARKGPRMNQPGDIVWFTPAGEEMTDDDWAVGFAKSLTVFLNGAAITEPDPRGERIKDESFLLLFNASEMDL